MFVILPSSFDVRDLERPRSHVEVWKFSCDIYICIFINIYIVRIHREDTCK